MTNLPLLTTVEVKDLSRTRFFENDTPLSLSIDESDKAELDVNWKQNTWKFSGNSSPIPGTLLIVEDLPDGTSKVVGLSETFFKVFKKT